MDRLADAALAYLPRDRPFRALVAPAGRGDALVALAQAIWDEARYAALADDARSHAVLGRIRGADDADHGAVERLKQWATAPELAERVVTFGEPLAFGDEPVQGQLFSPTIVPSPPAAFGEPAYDIVLADVPRGDLSAAERGVIRRRFTAGSGQFTAEIPFIERVAGLVAPGGILALRVRKAIIRREFGRDLVRELGRRMQLLSVDEDGDHVVAVLRATPGGDGAMLLRVFGSESAARVLRAMEQRARQTLGDCVETAIGSTSNPGYDEVWQPPRWLESVLPTMPFVRGADIANWRLQPETTVVWPYDEAGHRRSPPDETVLTLLSRFRVLLEAREWFGRTLGERDVRWYEYLEHHPERWGRLPAIAIARVGSSPRVALVRESFVVGGSAFLLNPAPTVDPYFLAGVLGSRAASFWMKQVFHVYETDEGTTFELTTTGLADFPIPEFDPRVADAAKTLERVARSVRPLRAVIDGEPERLAARLDSAHEGNAELLRECQRLAGVLDEAVFAAYGVDPDLLTSEPVAEFTDRTDEREVLLDWLVDVVGGGFASHELPTRRPVDTHEVADWLRMRPLCRAVLARLNVDAIDVLMRGAVPSEANLTFSPSGLEKLRSWANGDPASFSRADYAAIPLEVPRVSASALRNSIWRWRGRFNAPREPFTLLGRQSRERGRAMFAWAGAPDDDRERWAEAHPETRAQVDLELLSQLQVLVRQRPRTQAQLADALFVMGWSSMDVQLALEALQRVGSLTEHAGSWSAL